MKVDLSKYSVAGFDRGASRFKESLWVIVRCLFFMPEVPFPSKWRVALLKFFGAEIGRGAVIRSGVNVHFPWRLKIKDHVWLGEGVYLLNLAPITIGSNVCISQHACLCTGSHDYKSSTFDLIVKPVTLEDGVWIGAGCWVGPGVTMGSQAVLMMGSVATKNLAANGIYRGNPAECVKERVIS